ncbi:MAG: acyl-ACP--UDP-N-acetylglucosamine O-acyltransferase [Ignavibacteriales bacterium]|nr:acyl-ACP--UDP-N-acetylglucosamine O-acyltransferase [Ignavibacteriales bacterium]
MIQIHKTAIVSNKARIGKDIIVEPYAIIHDDVEIGDNCYVGPLAVIYDGARIGSNVKIHQGASVSNIPQDIKFANEETHFFIGDNTVIREFVTLHKGTKETKKASIGKNCLLMAYCHVAHDCKVGDNVIMANAVQLAGHVHIGDFATIGGGALIPQFITIGRQIMLGGGFKPTKDIPPFTLIGGYPAKFEGLNVVGLRRRGFSNEDIQTIKDIYTILYMSGYNFSQGVLKILDKYPDNNYAKEITDFVKNSKRGIIGK